MARQYIFSGETGKFFYEKLDLFHEKYVDQVLLNGVAPMGTDLESIKMTKNPSINKFYCERIVGGLTNIKPEIVVKFLDDRRAKIECIFTKINDQEYIDNVYMIQNIMNWPTLESYSCQIWYLKETSIEQIGEHWDE